MTSSVRSSDISLVLTTWNSRHCIGECLESLRRQTLPPTEILLVDNGSEDGTADYIRLEYPSVRLIALPKNRGPAHARNIAIPQTLGDQIVILDSDVRLHPHYLERLASQAHRPGIGMLGGRILSYDGSTLDSAGLILSRSYRFLDRAHGEPDTGQHSHFEWVFGVCSCAAWYSRECLEDLRSGEEYFDEDFFYLVEDVDLAWRAQRRGWKVGYEPRAIAYHQRNGSRLKRRQRQYLSFRNRYLMLAKNGALENKWEYLQRAGLYDATRLLYMLGTNTRLTLKALRELRRLSPRMQEKGRFSQNPLPPKALARTVPGGEL
ncbi:MAG: glycosyltransferase family 2 protein [Candidatus Omnitrophica bacterium]|nr:glycosyltransferase family 2 protein [Candidatus Omnitrophota bacterium]